MLLEGDFWVERWVDLRDPIFSLMKSNTGPSVGTHETIIETFSSMLRAMVNKSVISVQRILTLRKCCYRQYHLCNLI